MASKIILSLEDDADIANLLRLLVTQAPVKLLSAQTARDATQFISEQTPDLILLDLMLPEIDGLDFLAGLRADPRYADIPVIVVTVRTDTEHRQWARELGVFRYLVKPFSPAVLRHEIQAALGVDWSDIW